MLPRPWKVELLVNAQQQGLRGSQPFRQELSSQIFEFWTPNSKSCQVESVGIPGTVNSSV